MLIMLIIIFQNDSLPLSFIEHVATTHMMLSYFFINYFTRLTFTVHNNNYADYYPYLPMLLSHYYSTVK